MWLGQGGSCLVSGLRALMREASHTALPFLLSIYPAMWDKIEDIAKHHLGNGDRVLTRHQVSTSVQTKCLQFMLPSLLNFMTEGKAEATRSPKIPEDNLRLQTVYMEGSPGWLSLTALFSSVFMFFLKKVWMIYQGGETGN